MSELFELENYTLEMTVSMKLNVNNEVLFQGKMREFLATANEYMRERCINMGRRWEAGIDVVSTPLQRYGAYLELE